MIENKEKVREAAALLEVIEEAASRVRARHEIEAAAADQAHEMAQTIRAAIRACPGAVSVDGLCFAVQGIEGIPGEFATLYSAWRARCDALAAAP